MHSMYAEKKTLKLEIVNEMKQELADTKNFYENSRLNLSGVHRVQRVPEQRQMVEYISTARR